MQILLVDDEAELTHPLSHILKREGYQVDVAHDGAEGDRMAATGKYDLLILDWMLPHKSGLEICQTRRSQGDTTPVLFLTAKDTIDDRVSGLDAGADDYLVKPFELRELLARVRALLRRLEVTPQPSALQPSALQPSALQPSAIDPQISVTPSLVPTPKFQVGDLELDLTNQLATRLGRKIELSEKECQLLAYFMRYPEQLLTHEQIHQAVWSDGEKPSSNVLAAQIRLLRRKIETEGEPPLIHTVYGKGYRLGTDRSQA